MKIILKLKGAQKINKAEQKLIIGGNNPLCEIAISLDGTLCLCLGWYPNGTGTCSPGNP